MKIVQALKGPDTYACFLHTTSRVQLTVWESVKGLPLKLWLKKLYSTHAVTGTNFCSTLMMSMIFQTLI